MIDDTTVSFLGNPLIEATVACLHVENWNFATFRWNHGEAAVGIAKHQHRIGLLLYKRQIDLGYEIADRLRGAVARCFQKSVRISNSKILKKIALSS